MNIQKKVREAPINSLKPRGFQPMSVVCARQKYIFTLKLNFRIIDFFSSHSHSLCFWLLVADINSPNLLAAANE